MKLREREVFAMNRVIWMLLLSFTTSWVVHASENDQRMTAKQTAFFAGVDGQGVECSPMFRYSKVFAQDTPASNADNEYVLKEFVWWMNKIIKDEYVPSDDFIDTHLLLYSANGQTRKEDVAMLPFHTLGSDYLIVQTGGPEGRIWVYARSESAAAVQHRGEANSSLIQLLNAIIREDYQSYIPDMETEEQKGVFMGKPSTDLRGKKKNYVQYAVAGQDVCVVLQKVSFTDPEPGMLPQSDEWFSFSRRKALESTGSKGSGEKTDYQERRALRKEKLHSKDEVQN
jgi:hypothetical protein